MQRGVRARLFGAHRTCSYVRAPHTCPGYGACRPASHPRAAGGRFTSCPWDQVAEKSSRPLRSVRDSGRGGWGDRSVRPDSSTESRHPEARGQGKGWHREDRPDPRPPPPHRALGHRREAPRGRGHGSQPQQCQGHSSAVSTSSRT